MNEATLQHDPYTKQQIKDLLYNSLYAPIKEQLQKRLELIIYRNTMLQGASHKSFSYKGQIYSCDTLPLPRKVNRLHSQLKDEMEDYLSELKELNDQELPYVLGYITQVLNASNDLCDYYKLLPEALHNPLREFIETCPCRHAKLSPDAIQHIQQRNQKTLQMMRERMVKNLLI